MNKPIFAQGMQRFHVSYIRFHNKDVILQQKNWNKKRATMTSLFLNLKNYISAGYKSTLFV